MDRERKVEQRLTVIRELCAGERFLDECYRRIARAELEREGRLVEALRDASTRLHYCGDRASGQIAWDVVHHYEAEFAPLRTVEQIAAEVVLMLHGPIRDELSAALKRRGGE